MEINDFTINDFTIFNLENRTKSYPSPGIHGLHVYISNYLAETCIQISENDFYCNLVIWIKVAECFILGALYIPHEGSEHHTNTIYDDLSLDICNIKNKFDLPILLMGDFNSRTSNANDIMMIESQDIILDASNFKYLNIINILNSLGMPITRVNKDTKINNNGRRLTEMCKLQELCILNGRAGLDRNIGNLTFDEKSTIDYMICTPDLLHKISHCKVDKLDTMLTDKHNPIQLSINIEESISHEDRSLKGTESTIKECITKCKWDDCKKEEYKMAFDERKINEIFDIVTALNATETTQDSMDIIANNLKEIFLEPAKTTGMFTKCNINKKKRRNYNKPWFNNECIISKKGYKNFKKSLSNNPNDTEKAAFKALANKHKQLLRKEKKKI